MVFWIGFGGVFFAGFFFDLQFPPVTGDPGWFLGRYINGIRVSRVQVFWLCFDYDASGRNNLGSGEQPNIVPIRGPGAGFYLSLAKMIQFDLRKYINFSLGWQNKQPRWKPETTNAVSFNHCSRFYPFFVGHNDGSHFLTQFQMVHDI